MRFVPPSPPNRKVAAPGRETASIARSPAPDREVTDRDGRSFSGEPWGRLLSSRSEPPTGAVLLELWGHAVQLIRARDPQWLANASHGVPLCVIAVLLRTDRRSSAIAMDSVLGGASRLADHVYSRPTTVESPTLSSNAALESMYSCSMYVRRV